MGLCGSLTNHGSSAYQSRESVSSVSPIVRCTTRRIDALAPRYTSADFSIPKVQRELNAPKLQHGRSRLFRLNTHPKHLAVAGPFCTRKGEQLERNKAIKDLPVNLYNQYMDRLPTEGPAHKRKLCAMTGPTKAKQWKEHAAGVLGCKQSAPVEASTACPSTYKKIYDASSPLDDP